MAEILANESGASDHELVVATFVRRWPPALPWIVLFALIVLLPVSGQLFHKEASRWSLARAENAELEGDYEAVQRYAEHAIERWNGNLDAYHQLIGSYLSRGNARDAVPICNTLVELAREAHAADDRGMMRLTLASALNTSAYALALAGENLEVAKEQIDECLQLWGEPAPISFTDTRVYVYHRLGLDAEVIDQANLMIQELEEVEYPAGQAQLRQLAENIADRRVLVRQRKMLQDTRAVLYQHRGLVHAALGHQEEAEADFARAKEYGYDPAVGVW
jgi:hypothetical protein